MQEQSLRPSRLKSGQARGSDAYPIDSAWGLNRRAGRGLYRVVARPPDLGTGPLPRGSAHTRVSPTERRTREMGPASAGVPAPPVRDS